MIIGNIADAAKAADCKRIAPIHPTKIIQAMAEFYADVNAMPRKLGISAGT